MNNFIDLTAITVEDTNPLLSLLFIQQTSTPTRAISLLASEVVGFESVPQHQHLGRPNAVVMLKDGQRLYVKEHVSTVAALVNQSMNDRTPHSAK